MKLIFLKPPLLFFSLLIFLATVNFSIPLKNSTLNSTADANLSKDQRFPAGKKKLPSSPFPKYTQKLKSFMHVDIASTQGKDALPNNVYALTGTMTSLKDSNTLTSLWILPQGATLLEGSLSDIFYDIPLGESTKVRIKVKVDGSNNQKIFLKARAKLDNTGLSSTAQFNTLLQAEIKRGREKLFLKNKEYVKRHKTKLIY